MWRTRETMSTNPECASVKGTLAEAARKMRTPVRVRCRYAVMTIVSRA